MPLDVAKMQETQPETPGLPGFGQPNQKIGDLFVLVAQQRAVAIAGLTDPVLRYKRSPGSFVSRLNSGRPARC